MFSLFYGFWKFLFKKDEYYVLILGLDNAGKSTFLEQAKISFSNNYKGLNLSKITTTVGLNIGKVESNGVTINFWDLGGQEELQPLWDKYYSEAHGIIYLIDSSDKFRLEESKATFVKVVKNNALKSIPLLIVANKQDIENSVLLSKIQETFQLTTETIGNRLFYSINCSALKGEGVKEAINWMIDSVKSNSVNRPPFNEDL